MGTGKKAAKPAAKSAKKEVSFAIPKMSKAAVLVKPGKFEIKKFPIPPIGDDEMLVKVEGCGVCGTDGHEYKRDPFGLCPVVLGHEGSGTIVKLGKNITRDSAGVPVKLGDKIVTCVIPCGKCPACQMTPERTNLCDNCGVYGLFPDDDIHLNGYYAEYLKIRPNSTFFNVTGLNLDQRMLIEPAAVAIHAVERAKTTHLLNFDTKVLVQGAGPIGLMVIAVLRTLGINHIIVVDGNDSRLELAKEMGVTTTYNFTKFKKFDDLLAKVKEDTYGLGVGFAFQCTGVPAAAGNIWKFVRRGGGLLEVGFFLPMGTTTIDPHYDICNKEITAVGSWVYTPQEYPIAFAFLRSAAKLGLPMEKMVTHHFPLEKIGEALEANVSMAGIKIAVVVK